MTIPLVLADDHALVRTALAELLQSQPGMQVVCCAADGYETLQCLQEHRPRVLVVDLMLPRLNGLGVTRQAAQRYPEMGIVMLSMHAHESQVVSALRSGAVGYVTKDASADELVTAVRRAAVGKRYLCENVRDKVLASWVETAPLTGDPLASLTERERETFLLVLEGMTNAEIGEFLAISPRTVEKHRAKAMHKLGLHSAQEAFQFAMANGILHAV